MGHGERRRCSLNMYYHLLSIIATRLPFPNPSTPSPLVSKGPGAGGTHMVGSGSRTISVLGMLLQPSLYPLTVFLCFAARGSGGAASGQLAPPPPFPHEPPPQELAPRTPPARHDRHRRPAEDFSQKAGSSPPPEPGPQAQAESQEEAQERRGGGERQVEAVLCLRAHCPLWDPGAVGGHSHGGGGLLAQGQRGQ